MIIKEKCEHKNTIKAGIGIYFGMKIQRIRCRDCGTIFKGNIIEVAK